MAKHAELSPSSAKRWMTCPGSVVLSRGRENKSSSYADEGTAAHFIGSLCLDNAEDAARFVGSNVYLQKNHDGVHFEALAPLEDCEVLNVVDFTDSMADDLQVYLDYVRDVLASTGGTLFVEVSVPIDHLTEEEDARGTSDVVIVTDDEIIVIDLKFGRGVEVSAERNPQMLMYASGATVEYAMLGPFSRIRMAISQPRISRLPSEWSCTADELVEFEEEASKAAKVAMSIVEPGTAFLHPSDEACKFCLAKPCAALDAKVQEEIGASFDEILTGPPPAIAVAFDSNDTLGEKMACLDLIEDWCKAVRGECERRLLSGQEVPGYKVVQGKKGNRAWADEEKADKLLARLKLKQEERYNWKLISPTQAEKLLKNDPEKWAKAEALITQSEGQPSVAPVSDKRPAITVSAASADDFDTLA